jgi:hypothetical protein
MRERRKQERKSLMAYTQVFDLYGGFLLGYLGDLTLKGAMMISERAYPKDTEITLSPGNARTAKHQDLAYDPACPCGVVRTGSQPAVFQCGV